MKALKIIGIIVGVMVAAMLVIPLFLPATTEVSSEIEIALEPSQVFPFVASYEDRGAWDPWVAMDSTTVVTIEPRPGFVGSSYSWVGERLGTGKMEVVSVTGNEMIASHLWFGDMELPAKVQWDFEKVEGGTLATWSFSQESPYPFGRLGMIIGKGIMKRSFDTGLSKLKEYLEANPPLISPLGPITIETQQPFHALVAKGGSTVEVIGEQFQMLYSKVWEELAIQELHVTGPGFANYLDYDQATGYSNFLVGFMVEKAGVSSGEVLAVSYPEMKVVRAVHTGPYEDFTISYGILEKYIEENALETTGEVFEFYTVSMPQEPDPARWQTLIAFPLR